MLRFVFALFLLLPFSALLAQEDAPLSLADYEFTIPRHTFQVETILDARMDTAQWGWANLMGQGARRLVLEGNLTEQVMDLCTRAGLTAPRPMRLVLRVDSLSLNIVKGTQVHQVRGFLAVSYFTKVTDSVFYYVGQVEADVFKDKSSVFVQRNRFAGDLFQSALDKVQAGLNAPTKMHPLVRSIAEVRSFQPSAKEQRGNSALSPANEANIGFGAGLEYGGVGVRLAPFSLGHIDFFGGLGYDFVGTGVNGGISLRLGRGEVIPCIDAMYGYNGTITTIDAYNNKDKTTYYGPSVAFMLHIRTGRAGRNFFSVGVVAPSRPEFKKRINQLKGAGNDVTGAYDILMSLGFHIPLQ